MDRRSGQRPRRLRRELTHSERARALTADLAEEPAETAEERRPGEHSPASRGSCPRDQVAVDVAREADGPAADERSERLDRAGPGQVDEHEIGRILRSGSQLTRARHVLGLDAGSMCCCCDAGPVHEVGHEGEDASHSPIVAERKAVSCSAGPCAPRPGPARLSRALRASAGRVRQSLPGNTSERVPAGAASIAAIAGRTESTRSATVTCVPPSTRR